MMRAGQTLRERPPLRAAGRAVAQAEAVLGALRGLHHRNAALQRRKRSAEGSGARPAVLNVRVYEKQGFLVAFKWACFVDMATHKVMSCSTWLVAFTGHNPSTQCLQCTMVSSKKDLQPRSKPPKTGRHIFPSTSSQARTRSAPRHAPSRLLRPIARGFDGSQQPMTNDDFTWLSARRGAVPRHSTVGGHRTTQRLREPRIVLRRHDKDTPARRSLAWTAA